MTDAIAPGRLQEALYLQWLKQQGYQRPQPHPNKEGRWVALAPFLFTMAIIEGDFGDTCGYSNRWCYHDQWAAEEALESWKDQPEPAGWHRHLPSGRRRNLETGEEYLGD